MIVILACAKRQRIPHHSPIFPLTTPFYNEQAKHCLSKLANYSALQLASLLKVSQDLANVNLQRFQEASLLDATTYAALDTFDGDVYRAMQRDSWHPSHWEHAQHHLRIISGLYGVLRPFDAIVPHRLEMSTRLPWLKTSLAHHWQSHNQEFFANDPQADTIINLASQEYAQAVDANAWQGHWINIQFWDRKKDGSLAIIGIKSKQARGRMIEAICKNKWDQAMQLQQFNNGYHYAHEHSQANTWVYIAH